jgi:hypothetical protein
MTPFTGSNAEPAHAQFVQAIHVRFGMRLVGLDAGHARESSGELRDAVCDVTVVEAVVRLVLDQHDPPDSVLSRQL